MKRTFDILFAITSLLVLFPLLLIISVVLAFNSKESVFYLQRRVGKASKEFSLIKFRTMVTGSDTKGLITVGQRDSRITPAGYFLRRFKLDELPQLINVLKGEMSIVGPRPEVRKYVELYNSEQRKILEVRPGITDYASLIYFNENELLGNSADPESTYVNEVMPAKLELNKKYLSEQGFLTDLKIILRTFTKIISGH